MDLNRWSIAEDLKVTGEYCEVSYRQVGTGAPYQIS